MSAQKEAVAASIISAQADLTAALQELQGIDCNDASSIAFASHALNNYLTVIGGVAELAVKRLRDHSDAQLLRWLEGVHHATDMMSHIVSQLMGTAAIDAGKLRFGKVDLTMLTRRMCDYYTRAADKKGIDVEFSAEADLPQVWTDVVALASVLDNILSNAVKYSPHGTNIHVRLRRSGTDAICEVQDEGPGLDREDFNRLFQKGAQLKPKPTGGESSTGYGLAVAKELIEKLQGEIWCQTAPGEGCRFSFRLPAYREGGGEHRPQPVTDSDRKSRNAYADEDSTSVGTPEC